MRVLDAATDALETVAKSVGARAGQAEEACIAALRAVCGAEREVLRLIVSGPVYRLVRSPPAFAMAVAALSAELRVDLQIDPMPFGRSLHNAVNSASGTPRGRRLNPSASSPRGIPGEIPEFGTV